MNLSKSEDTLFDDTDEMPGEEEEYDELEMLERLESLREDMEDLGVKTLKEVIQRIDDLHKKLDSREK